MSPNWNEIITTKQALRELYGAPVPPALIKEIDYISPHYRSFVERSPFVILATCGSDGIDCSPRGDAPGFVRVHDEKTLLIPDRPGNNRIDSLRNIVSNLAVAPLFLIPGIGETLRVTGDAVISTNAGLAQSFAVNGGPARTVIVVNVRSVFFQCSKAIVRSYLWDERSRTERGDLPSVGTILAALSDNRFGGEAYDRAAPERINANLY